LETLMLDKATYLAWLRADMAAIAAVAAEGLGRPVPACPGWTLSELLGHLGGVYRWVGAVARERPQDRDGMGPLREHIEREHIRQATGDVAAEFQRAAEGLLDALEALGPDTPLWSWSPQVQRGIFWHRRMAHETLIHRWDAQQAVGAPDPIEIELALDGIGETFDAIVPFRRRGRGAAGQGETFSFQPTDSHKLWTVQFDAEGITLRQLSLTADLTLRAPAADLLLFLWHRLPASALQLEGDPALVDRYFELAPPL
jgi:uncharacterized protein (TIGR03083 family)